MGALANSIESKAQELIPTVPVSSSLQLLTGPGLLMILAEVVTAIRELEGITAGADFRLETVAPSPVDGEDGDSWLNAVTGDLSKKVAGVWEPRGNLRGAAGRNGTNGTNGSNGTNGTNGKSTYQLWQEAGNTGTLAAFLAAQKGANGNDGRDGQDGTVVFLKTYAPDDTIGVNGNQWTYVNATDKTASFYEKIDGKWRQVGVTTGGGSTTTPTPTTNTAPSVSVTTTNVSGGIRFNALAADSDGVKSIFVKVYDAATNGVLQTFGPSAPGDTSYTALWQNPPAGSYYAKAVATDTKDASTTSDPAVFSVAAANATPAAPVVVYNSSTRRLSASHSLNGTILYSFQGSAFVEYTGSISVDNLEHAPGEWKFKRAASTGYNESEVANSPAIAAYVAPVGPLVATDANAVYNTWNLARSGYTVRSAFSEWHIETDSSTFDLTQYSTSQSVKPDYAGCAVVDGATFVGIFKNTAVGEQTKTVSLPGTGRRVIRIINGSQELQDSAQDQLGTFAVRTAFPASAYAAILSHTATDTRLGLLTDSIGVGIGTQIPQLHGYGPLLRGLLRYDVAHSGWGNRSWANSLGTEAQQDAEVARWVTYFQNATRQQLWVALATNDYRFNTPLPQFKTIVSGFLQKLRAALPLLKLFLQTPVVWANESQANSIGLTMADYRTALAEAATTVSGVTVVNGLEILPASDLDDNYHPGNAGNLKYRTFIYNALNATAEPLILGDNFLQVNGTEDVNMSTFSTALAFEAPDAAQTSQAAQLSCKALLPPSGTIGTYGLYVAGGQVKAVLYGTGLAEADATLVVPCPASGLVTVLFEAGPAGRSLTVNGVTTNGSALPIAASTMPITLGAVRTGTGNQTANTALKRPVKNFSLFTRYRTQAEKDFLMASSGQVSSLDGCVSYSALQRRSTADTALLDVISGQESILILNPNSTAGTGSSTGGSTGGGTAPYTYATVAANQLGLVNMPGRFDGYAPRGGQFAISDAGAGGVKVTLTFNGTQFVIEAPAGPNGGVWSVMVDGNVIGTASIFNEGGVINSRVIFTSPVLAAGTHTIELTLVDPSKQGFIAAIGTR